MVIKSSFEPKDARITCQEEYDPSDEEDDVLNLQQPRKRKTGTQALVEFLNTTSPEEFQKNGPNKGPSALFFRKRKSTATTTDEKQRKNYIEIIANPFNFKPKNSKLSPTLSHPTMIPLRKGAMLPKSNVVNMLPKGGAIVQPSLQPSQRLGKEDNEKEEDDNDDEEEDILRLTTTPSVDIIEKGLKQRLDYYRESQLQKPSDLISKSVAQEHTMALEVVFSMVNHHHQQENQENKHRKSKTRHVQVQTLPYNHIEMTQAEEALMLVQQELEQEKLLNSKLEATLEEITDHYETLCGLAYSKLRQVWEEKVRWENACYEAKESCWYQHQQQTVKSEQ